MELVKATSGATCGECRGRIRKGSWVTSLGGFWIHRGCYKEPTAKDTCEACQVEVPVDAAGKVLKHPDPNRNGYVCDGSPAEEIREERESPGWVVSAEEPAEPKKCGGCGEPAPAHDKWCNGDDSAPGQPCGVCGHWVYGDRCDVMDCGWRAPEPVSVAPATVEKMDDTALPFAMPTTVDPPEPEINVSGQPEPKRDQWGRYLLPHPVTGLYSDGKDKPTRRNGWMRATTFAKLAADTFSLTRYNERLTLLGATLRPDVVALAHGKHVKRDNKELNRLVTEVKETAGAKVAANIGTAVHSFTERVDAGTLKVDEVPADYIPHVVNYLKELEKYGLEPVPGLIERTTLVDEWGKVIVGTFDRVLYHRASGTYLIGDLKTGETLDWGKMEIAVQLALYAHGINAHGVFDWNTGEWQPSGSYGDSIETGPWSVPKVRTDYGVVMHLPIQGPNAGVCTLRRVNLAAGWDAAATSASVDTSRKRSDYMDDDFALPVAEYSPETPAELPPAEPMDWVAMAKLVQSRDEASVLWHRAKADGVVGVALNEVVQAAQQRLRELGVLG